MSLAPGGSPDGERFLVVIPEILAGEQPLTAILNMTPLGERSKVPAP